MPIQSDHHVEKAVPESQLPVEAEGARVDERGAEASRRRSQVTADQPGNPQLRRAADQPDHPQLTRLPSRCLAETAL